MADIYLTEKDDTYDHPRGNSWVNIRALGGNDVITIHGRAGVLGGPGNDLIINDVFSGPDGAVAYWDSPNSIYVDLEAGYALDGFGTRDTLVNIRDVTTSGRNGDVVLELRNPTTFGLTDLIGIQHVKVSLLLLIYVLVLILSIFMQLLDPIIKLKFLLMEKK